MTIDSGWNKKQIVSSGAGDTSRQKNHQYRASVQIKRDQKSENYWQKLLSQDLRLVPIAVASWIGSAVGLYWQTSWPISLLLGPGCLIVILWAKRAKKLIFVAAGLSLLVTGVLAGLQANRLTSGGIADQLGKIVTVQARLCSDVKIYRNQPMRPYGQVQAQLLGWSTGEHSTKSNVAIKLVANGDMALQLAEIEYGSVIQARVKISTAKPAEPVAVKASLMAEAEKVNDPTVFISGVNRFRDGLRKAMVHTSSEAAGLVPSFVVGDTSRLDQQMADDFKTTGLTHLTAVSGSNLTLLLAFLLGASKWIGVRGWWLRLIQVIGVGLFIVVCRGEPSVIRAGAMGLVGVAALGQTVDPRKGLRNLCLAIWLLLLIDPWLSLNWGFGLSVCATAGILWWAAPWQKQAQKKWPKWIAEAICVPLAAQLATMPLVVALSNQISLVGLLANVACGPFVGPVTLLGLICGLVGLLSPIGATFFGWLAGLAVQPVIWIAHLGAGVARPTITLTPNFLTIGAVILAGLVLSALIPVVIKKKWLSLILIAGLLAACFLQPRNLFSGEWKIVFCSVGQGDMTLLKVTENQAVVVDVGPEEKLAKQCLARYGVKKIPVLVLTHFHSDHVDGLASVVSETEIGKIIISPLHSPKDAYQRVRSQAESSGIQLEHAYPGQTWQVGDVNWLTLATGLNDQIPPSNRINSAVENNHSIISKVQVKETAVLLAGDAEPEEQRVALESANRLGISLRSDVIKIPHHGSSNQEPRFFKQSEAKTAVASCGKNNDFGHPAPKTIRLAEQLGMQVERTDQDKDVVIK